MKKIVIIICAVVLVAAFICVAVFLPAKTEPVTYEGERLSVEVTGINKKTLNVSLSGTLLEGAEVKLYDSDYFASEEKSIENGVYNFCLTAKESIGSSISCGILKDGDTIGTVELALISDAKLKFESCEIYVDETRSEYSFESEDGYHINCVMSSETGTLILEIKTDSSVWSISNESDLIDVSGPFDVYDESDNHKEIIVYINALKQGYAEFSMTDYANSKVLNIGIDCFATDEENSEFDINLVNFETSAYIPETIESDEEINTVSSETSIYSTETVDSYTEINTVNSDEVYDVEPFK